ncbi:MAG: glycosyltransferase family 4 protein [Planctomycetes bacterium]|nr:glycosyltransferase family 4 protein [Planctomycetota bacterium]
MNAAKALHARGYAVHLWGIEAVGDAQAMRMPTDEGMSLKLLRSCRPGWRQKVHYLQFVFLCIRNTLVTRPQVVYCSDLWSYPIGWILSRVFRFRVIAHEHDTPLEGGRFATRVCFLARGQLFPKVTVVFPQRDRAQRVSREIGVSKSIIVWNCPRRDEVCGSRKLETSGDILLWYHGSVVPTQFPRVIVDALKRLPDNYRLRFAGYETIGHLGYIKEFLRYAEAQGVGRRVSYVGTIATREELFFQASQCDIGLALFDRSFREPMVGASNKPFDYLACGLGVLANGTEEWRSFFREVPSVLHCDPSDSGDIAGVVSGCAREAMEWRCTRAMGVEKMTNEWHYENQFEKVIQEIGCR